MVMGKVQTLFWCSLIKSNIFALDNLSEFWWPGGQTARWLYGWVVGRPGSRMDWVVGWLHTLYIFIQKNPNVCDLRVSTNICSDITWISVTLLLTYTDTAKQT